MAAIRNSFNIFAAHAQGCSFYYTWRKTFTQATSAGYWFDVSMSPGNPAPNYYIGTEREFTPLSQALKGGIPHPLPNDGNTYYLQKLLVLATSAGAYPLPMILLDYLGFYSFLTEDELGDFDLFTNVDIPRVGDGVGVQIMPVVIAGHQATATYLNVKYTNQDGVSGRQTQTAQFGMQAVNGTLLCTSPTSVDARGPFLTLQEGDTGVLKLDSYKIIGTPDVGLFALVLVKPIASIALREAGSPAEVDYLLNTTRLPILPDDGYLNFICLPAGNITGSTLIGEISGINTTA